MIVLAALAERKQSTSTPLTGAMWHGSVQPLTDHELLDLKKARHWARIPTVDHDFYQVLTLGAEPTAAYDISPRLCPTIGTYLEPSFRHDFSGIRVHANSTYKAKVLHVDRRYAQPGLLQKQADEKVRSRASWNELTRRVKEALAYGDRKGAEETFREAIILAASNITLPSTLPSISLKAEDIRLDFKLADFAETRASEIPANEDNYWHWIYFGPSSLGETQAFTEATIIHELIHVRQFYAVLMAYKANASPDKGNWEDFLKPFTRRARVEGPEELEAEITVLPLLASLKRQNLQETFRNLFISYLKTSSYIPLAGETVPINAAKARPQILDAYTKADAATQKLMGEAVWWALIKVDPASEIWLRFLREWSPLAMKAYSDKTFKLHYDSFLKLKGLKYTDIVGEESKTVPVQRFANDRREIRPVPPIVYEVLGASGRPLDTLTRAYMESLFEQDFSSVQMHIDSRAAKSAAAVNALAYTVGRDIVFGQGQYAPGTRTGQKLLAHELTHVMQQGGERTGLRSNLILSDPNDVYEREANTLASNSIALEGRTLSTHSVEHLSSFDYLLRQETESNLFSGGLSKPRLSFYQKRPLDRDQENFFRGLAESKARAIRAIKLSGSESTCPAFSPDYGAIPYDTGADIIKAITATYRCTGKPVKEVHIFSHSAARGVFGSKPTVAEETGLYREGPSSEDRSKGGRSVGDIPKAALAEDIVFVMHGCNTAFGDNSFAEALLKDILSTSPRARVYGRYEGGDPTKSKAWKEFSASYPEGRYLKGKP